MMPDRLQGVGPDLEAAHDRAPPARVSPALAELDEEVLEPAHQAPAGPMEPAGREATNEEPSSRDPRRRIDVLPRTEVPIASYSTSSGTDAEMRDHGEQ